MGRLAPYPPPRNRKELEEDIARYERDIRQTNAMIATVWTAAFLFVVIVLLGLALGVFR